MNILLAIALMIPLTVLGISMIVGEFPEFFLAAVIISIFIAFCTGAGMLFLIWVMANG